MTLEAHTIPRLDVSALPEAEVTSGDIRLVGMTHSIRFNFVLSLHGSTCSYLTLDQDGSVLSADHCVTTMIHKRPKIGSASFPKIKVKFGKVGK